MRDLIGNVRQLHREYGDCVSFRAGPTRINLFMHPDAFREVLDEKRASFHKPKWWKKVFRRWNGGSLVLNDGPTWDRQRRMVSAAMPSDWVHAVTPTAARRTREMFAPLVDQDVDMMAQLERLSFDITGEAVLGEDYAPQSDKMFEAYTTLHAVALLELRGLSALPDWLPIGPKRRLRRALNTYHEVLREPSERRLADGSQDDLLGRLLGMADALGDGQTMDAQAARDEAGSLIFAGKETPAAAFLWTMYLLAKHPEAQDRAAAEIQQVLGGREAAAADIPRLCYTRMVMQEAMRLYPAAYMVTREAIENVQVCGFDVRKRSQVMLCTFEVHHDPRWFDEPEVFRPERFDPEGDSIQPGTFIPFGVGPRVCVGGEFAMVEGAAILATVLGAYRIELSPGQGEPEFEPLVALYPKGGLQLRLTRR
jgi:cytochrome P450